MQYFDFELEVTRAEAGTYTVRVLRSPAGEATGTLRLPFGSLALQNRLQALQIALLRSGTTRRRVDTPESRTVESFGQELWSTLFSGDVLSRFEASRMECRRVDAGMRIKLRIESPELAALPWEYLFDGDRGDYLTLSASTPVVRYIPLPQTMAPLRVQPPLRILAMVVSPSDMPDLDVERERQRLDTALSRLTRDGLVEVMWMEGGTTRDLQQALWKGPWHIFHFVGHGGFDETRGEGVVVMANEKGTSQLVSATNLGRLLGDHDPLRLAVLNACDSARGDAVDVFSSTAATLVRRGTPAVVAMQYEITDDAAIEFSRDFYEAIASGIAVDEALAEARKGVALAIPGTLEWGTPVLFMRAPDGVLFDIPPAARQAVLTATGTDAVYAVSPITPSMPPSPAAGGPAAPAVSAATPEGAIAPAGDAAASRSLPEGAAAAAVLAETGRAVALAPGSPADAGPAGHPATGDQPSSVGHSTASAVDPAPAGKAQAPWWTPKTATPPPPTAVPGWSAASGTGARSGPGVSGRGGIPMKVIIPGAAVMLFAVFGLGILAAGGQGGPSPSAFGPAFLGSGAIADGSQGAIGRPSPTDDGREPTLTADTGEPSPPADTREPSPTDQVVGPAAAFPAGILFANDSGELSDIMFVDPSGDNLHPVLPGPTDDAWPSWSPDRTRIAFTRVTDGHGEIWLIDFHGKETRITSGADDWEPNWSADGSLLTFWRVTNGHDEIWVVRNDGSDATAITHGPDFDVSPSWSPNGDLIAFSSTRSHDGGSYLYTYNTGSREVVRRTFPESRAKPAMDSWPAWSGDGSSIAFAHALASSPDKRTTWLLDTTTWKAEAAGDVGADERGAIFSPDGQRMSYCTNDSGSYHVVVWDPQTTDVLDVTPDQPGNSCQPSWR